MSSFRLRTLGVALLAAAATAAVSLVVSVLTLFIANGQQTAILGPAAA